MQYEYIYQNKINTIKKLIIDSFEKNVYDYQEIYQKIKTFKNSDLLNVIDNKQLIMHLIRSAIYQLKLDNKIFKYKGLCDKFVYDDFNPIEKFIQLELDNSYGKNKYFINTMLTTFLQNNNEAILPNAKKICFYQLFLDNFNLKKYFNLFKVFFDNIIFIDETSDNTTDNDFISKLIELENISEKKFGKDSTKKYYEFINNEFSLLSKRIKLHKNHKKIEIIKNRNINKNKVRTFINDLINCNNKVSENA